MLECFTETLPSKMGLCKSKDLDYNALSVPDSSITNEIEMETEYQERLKVFDKSFADMLTFGFIRLFEETTNNLTIPLCIYQLCASYRYHYKAELFKYRFKFNNSARHKMIAVQDIAGSIPPDVLLRMSGWESIAKT